MSVAPLRLGTRASALARWQADWVAEQLRKRGEAVELVFITTQGDVKAGPLGQIGGQGLFTKELQRALVEGEIDLAVHSLKDLPTIPVPGLGLGAIPEREAVHDLLLCPTVCAVDNLPPGARVGTGSLRRKAQLLNRRPDLQVLDIRGNLDTRIRKLTEGQYDAIILAAAGVGRLGAEKLSLDPRHAHPIPREVMLPAVGQGALGVECRSDDARTLAALAPLNHADSRAAALAERALLAELLAGCLAPVAAWAQAKAGRLVLEAAVLSPNGGRKLTITWDGELSAPEALGQSVARQLLAAGAQELIQAARSGG